MPLLKLGCNKICGRLMRKTHILMVASSTSFSVVTGPCSSMGMHRYEYRLSQSHHRIGLMGLRPVRRPVDLLESDDGSRFFFWAATNNWLGQLAGVRSHTGCSLSIIEYCGTRFGQKDLLVAKDFWEWCLGCCGQSIWQHLVREDFLVDHGTI